MISSFTVHAQATRLLRQPTLCDSLIAFSYGGDIWVSSIEEENIAVRITSTPAVESDPHFSPDGKQIAFSSNRSGNTAVYVVSTSGGEATRLTWHPSAAYVRGWTNDGNSVLYASSRETVPTGFNRLWCVSKEGGPSRLVTSQWANDGSYSEDGMKLVVDRVSRWDSEWRNYRGGQNTPLILLDLSDQTEELLPNESTTDIQPVWLGGEIFFLSDRDGTSNIWEYTPESGAMTQITHFTGSDVKWLAGHGSSLAYEREGSLHMMDTKTGALSRLNIVVRGDFPWAGTSWIDVSNNISVASISPTGKRAIMEARGDIFTIPVEHGDARNLTRSPGAADRAPVWSPEGELIAWFSDEGGKGYRLFISNQDGLSETRKFSIGESKLGWEPVWSPDGRYIAFTDDDVRVRVIDTGTGDIRTIDTGGTNLERGSTGLTWSPDSKWLAYAKTGTNGFRRIMIWSLEENRVRAITNAFADSYAPAWDLDHLHLYFMASTNLALGSGWANTSAMTSRPEYGVYLVNLRKEDPSPFEPRSDEESEISEGPKEDEEEQGSDNRENRRSERNNESTQTGTAAGKVVTIDFEGIERRTLALPMPERSYSLLLGGPSGTVFIGERKPNESGMVLNKFSLEEREATEFASGLAQVSISSDGKKILARTGGSWKIMDATKPKAGDDKTLHVDLKVSLDRKQEWNQIFEEAWRYERDYFYDPDMHGRDWDTVYKRYAPLIPFVNHRYDLSYILDQMNGELSVGHSFVGGGDYPEVERSVTGMLGADLIEDEGRWRIERIYTSESWNPGLSSPLDRPGIRVSEGDYIVGINGRELTAEDDPYRYLDGTAGRQTVLHISQEPAFENAWREVVEPITSEQPLRQRAWVEDNRRMVDSLSNGRLAYIWVPNTGTPGLVSFDRYFFAQQDKEGAVIDERFNGGGLLDDYMVDLMTRSLRAAITNEVPEGRPMRLPSGILGPKALLINEMSGSGGDFFPWVFRQQKAGPLIGMRTWGGLVKSSVHYRLIDGGTLTAPDNAVFDPVNRQWIAENRGVPPDIEVRQDAISLAGGKDPQLERVVKELLKLLEQEEIIDIEPPPFSTPALPDVIHQ